MRIWKCFVLGALLSLSLSVVAHADVKDTKKDSKTALTCPVTGKVIADKAKAAKYTYKNKTYYFCCAGCVTKFKATPVKFTTAKATKPASAAAKTNGAKTGDCCADGAAKTEAEGGCCGEGTGGACCDDEKAATTSSRSGTKAASASNGSDTKAVVCAVRGSAISKPDTALKTVHGGKTYYFCCEGCQDKFLKDPAKYVKTQ